MDKHTFTGNSKLRGEKPSPLARVPASQPPVASLGALWVTTTFKCTLEG
jgi:hypothetical protein